MTTPRRGYSQAMEYFLIALGLAVAIAAAGHSIKSTLWPAPPAKVSMDISLGSVIDKALGAPIYANKPVEWP